MRTRLAICLLLFAGLSGCAWIDNIVDPPAPVQPLFVGPQRVSCVNPNRNNLCLLIRGKPEETWQLYKGEVMGLLFEPGFLYELQVRADTKSPPEEGGPDIQWVLYKIVSKKADVESTPIPVDLQGVLWILDKFGDPQYLTQASSDPIPTLFFQEDGHATGSSGCNRFNGVYSITGDQIRFTSLSATKKMCPTQTSLMEQEQSVFNTLQQAGRYQITNGQLYIYISGDGKVLIFKK
jgi:heat shock protein HslJ